MRTSSDVRPAKPATGHRADIQGLRALAVLLVALDHAGVPFLKGGFVGVDVFFVLSGYLITGVLVSSAEKERGWRYISSFYARRARRILPAATLTLVVTDLVAAHLVNLERAHEVFVASVSAAFFVVNFHFAALGTDYFAQGAPPSAVQHFWSLSVEEQFYLLWPLLIGIIVLGVRLKGRRTKRARQRVDIGAPHGLEIAAVAITTASLLYAAYDTNHSANSAYFSSLARAWELGLGAILWLNVKRLAALAPSRLAILGWLGVASIVGASTLYSESTEFPGLAALLPTLGAAAVIAAGLSVEQTRFAPSHLLSLRPLQYLGDRSYTFYLWHWPVLILAMEHIGHRLPLSTNLLLLVGALLLSMFTYAVFENPIRRGTGLGGARGLVLWPAAISTVLFASSIYWSDYQNAVNLTYAPAEATEVLHEAPGASFAASTEPAPSGWRPSSPSAVVEAVVDIRKSRPLPSQLIPSPLALPQAEYKVPKGCMAMPGETHASTCSLGDTSAKKSLVVFGDSHALMWMPAILDFAQREGYDVRPVLKYGCKATNWAGSEISGECSAWYKYAVAQVHALRPSLLLIGTHYNQPPAEGDVEFTAPTAIKNLTALDEVVRRSVGRVVTLGDPPGQEEEPTDCLLGRRATMKRCSYTEVSSQAQVTAEVEAATDSFGVFMYTTPWFCYHGTCPMVVGHTVVYFDRAHITQRYAESLGPLFTVALSRLLHHDGSSKSGRS